LGRAPKAEFVSMRSMTGFGQGQASVEGLTVQVEMSSVNRKNLDLHFSLPRGLSALEARCQKLVSDKCGRGRIQTRLLVESVETSGVIKLNEERAKDWIKHLNTFAAAEGLTPITSVTEVMRCPQVFGEDKEELSIESIWPSVESALTVAVDGLLEMRELEGEHLKTVLADLLEEIGLLLKRLLPLLPEAREERSEKIRTSLNGLGDLSPEMQSRLLQEIALQAEKADVQEEVDRLAGHLQQMRDKIQKDESVGRALDFLCQEMARELNTLSVKASRSDINQLALDGKELVEKIREQVQNVE